MNAISPTTGGKLGDVLGRSLTGPAGEKPPRTLMTVALTRRRPGPGLLTSLRAILPACSPNITEGAKDAPPQATLRGPSVEMVRRAVEALPNTSELFPTRESYLAVLYAAKASLPDEPEEALDIAMQWCLRWPGDANGPNDPEVVERDWRRMKPPFRRGWSWLAEMAERLGPPAEAGGFTRALEWVDLDAMAAVNARIGEEENKKAAHMTDASNWPDPVDLFGHADPLELGTPPAGSLPSTILAVAEDEARRKGVPVAFAAMAAVGTIAAAIGASIRIQPKLNDTGFTQPASLWVAIVAPPGSAKSPTMKALMRPLVAVDATWSRQDAPHHVEWERKLAAYGRRKDAPAPGQEPPLRRAVVDDVTPEALVRILARNPRGVLRVTDELFAFLGSFGAYKRTGDGDRSMALTLHDGGYLRSDRVGSGSLTADYALMGVLASTQPDKIQAKTRDLSDDGLLQRFLFLLHDGVDRRPADVEPDASGAAEYAAMVRAMAEIQPGKVLTMTPESRAVLEAAERKIADLAHIPGASSAWAGHISKWGMFLPRLVLIFSAVRDFEYHGVAGVSSSVDVETAEMAVRFAWFLLRHGHQFYLDFFGSSASASDAKWIAGWLLTRQPTESVTPRDIYQAKHDFRGSEGRSATLRAMGELERCGWVSVTERKPEEGPTKWAVNPKIHMHFVKHAERETIRRAQERDKIAKALSARSSMAGEG